MSADVIYKAFSATEEGFLSLVAKQRLDKPQIAAVGSCCLIGVICSGVLYIANAGDSRAVLGQSWKGSKEVKAVQLSAEHNASIESVREELRSLHPGDPQIVVLRHNVWRVKGIIQVLHLTCRNLLLLLAVSRNVCLYTLQLPASCVQNSFTWLCNHILIESCWHKNLPMTN